MVKPVMFLKASCSWRCLEVSCTKSKMSFSPKPKVGTKVAPRCSANRKKPRRRRSVRTYFPQEASKASAAPPTTRTTAFPGRSAAATALSEAGITPIGAISSRKMGMLTVRFNVHRRGVRPGNRSDHPQASLPKAKAAPVARTPWGWYPNRYGLSGVKHSLFRFALIRVTGKYPAHCFHKLNLRQLSRTCWPPVQGLRSIATYT
mmetsp:Transcript_45017/g.107022  ORF Transcript_45017/g.107022 Transcript_45017/m.107022 type:complete len:204 (+) Transcript_45017:300-911(+)